MRPDLPTGLYVHIPFCRARCAYCDFNTYAGLEALHTPFVAALLREIRRAANPRTRAATLFFGGGTPSLLEPEQIGDVVAACRASFGLAEGAEVTAECNPGTVDLDRLRRLRAAGVNRISLGAQSADPAELRLLGRAHGFADVTAAVDAARRAGFDDVSLDLIYGLPGQAPESWRRTLAAVLPLEPDHLSLYALTVEPGTPLHERVQRGESPTPDPDAAADMYEMAEEMLAAAGLTHYEISNWCRPGHACRHNLIYWRNEPFLGFGPGAHSSSVARRWWNVKRPAEYIARIGRGESVAEGGEEIDPLASRGETMLMGLRLLEEGVSYARFEARHGLPMREAFGPALREHQQAGLLDLAPDRAVLTRRGRLLSNRVFMAFV
jgi:oxygen-independent coproporphyrinogen-3 oxidase